MRGLSTALAACCLRFVPNATSFAPVRCVGSPLATVARSKDCSLHAKKAGRKRKGEYEDEQEKFNELTGRPGLQQPGDRVFRLSDDTTSVPMEQQPFNELQLLKDAPLFGWAQEDLKGFMSRLGGVYVGAMVVSYPISSTTFHDQLLATILAANIGSLAVVLLLLIRLYSGWSYVGQRLEAEVVPYEESGWYDGNDYCKAPGVRNRDSLLYQYEVLPVLKRIKGIMAAVGAAFVVILVGYKALVPEDPYMMYSSDYLESLAKDDDLAKDAASRSAKRGTNRPEFCESRFYQAMAGSSLCK